MEHRMDEMFLGSSFWLYFDATCEYNLVDLSYDSSS
jgi:hypothetical protein